MPKKLFDGTKAGPGRPKGKPNKVTVEVREMLRNALDQAGGTAYFVKQSKENPQAFMALVSKLIPSDIRATVTTATLEEILAGSKTDTP